VPHLTLKARARALLVLFAVLLVAACHEGEGVRVRSLTFDGVTAVAESDLRLALSTTESGKLPWSAKTYFTRQDFDEDLRRIESFYASHGFPEARVVSYKAGYNEDKTAIDLTIRIDEGQPLKVEVVRFVGFEQLPEEHLRDLQVRLPVLIGAPRDQEKVQVLRAAALDELREHGFPKATVALDEQPAATPHNLIVTLTATAGPYATFGEIEIAGLSSVGPEVVRRQLTYSPGQPFRLSSVQRSQRQLYALELFQFVNVEVGDVVHATDASGAPVHHVVTKVTVVEAPHRQTTLGIGYGSEDHARVDVKFTHVNFLGGARVGSAEGKFSSLERGVRLSFNEPALGHGLSAGLNGQSWYSNTPAYTLRTTGGRLGLLKTFASDQVGGRVRGSASITFVREYERYDVSSAALADLDFRPTLIALGLNPSTGEGRGTTSALALDIQRNTVANLLDARKGVLASAHAELAGKVAGGDFEYREASGEVRAFVPVGSTLVLAARMRAGSIGSSGDPNVTVPFFKRYFLGGATSLRGWGRFEVAPLTAAGLPIGGFSMLESSGEVRWTPGGGSLGLVGFLDAGNVWRESWRLHPKDLRSDVGLGLRYNTLVGALRFDLAYQLTPDDLLVIKGSGAGQYRRFRFHFSIGQAF
jgi:outer membrane protein assembly complex protein YaeT